MRMPQGNSTQKKIFNLWYDALLAEMNQLQDQIVEIEDEKTTDFQENIDTADDFGYFGNWNHHDVHLWSRPFWIDSYKCQRNCGKQGGSQKKLSGKYHGKPVDEPGQTVQKINQLADGLVEAGKLDIEAIDDSSENAAPFLNAVSDDLISMMRTNRVTGVFLILNADNLQSGYGIRDL